jgi:hypothetical protein
MGALVIPANHPVILAKAGILSFGPRGKEIPASAGVSGGGMAGVGGAHLCALRAVLDCFVASFLAMTGWGGR